MLRAHRTLEIYGLVLMTGCRYFGCRFNLMPLGHFRVYIERLMDLETPAHTCHILEVSLAKAIRRFIHRIDSDFAYFQATVL